MVLGPTFLLLKNKKKKQPERKIKNKRKVGNFQRNLGASPPLEIVQRLPAATQTAPEQAKPAYNK